MVREKQIRVVIIDEITDYLDHEDGMGNENSSYPILLKLKKLQNSLEKMRAILDSMQNFQTRLII